ncbi:type IV pilin N-terminal domain-containing protein [Methanosalsum natronophilum]|uniref:type IV pilin N-terminal domain-containing protein n=1 Tax=Methanosalsum natronophilum TaxID=768733 RepID=UPI0021682CCC|nr:type IV pilin N-terminal domain-containing protein [Methanosalsum natronophilum]MCS3924384.1 FlaG/FlaF family flagellin (archaellin) [Methanosalsum natronophilum]
MSLKNKNNFDEVPSKKYSGLVHNENAVSDVVGTLLMVTITVIMASLVTVSIFSIDPPSDVPQINYKIIENTHNSVDIIHMGGEPVEVSELLFVDSAGEKIDIDENSEISDDDIWRIGTKITLDPGDKRINIIHKPTQQLIR